MHALEAPPNPTSGAHEDAWRPTLARRRSVLEDAPIAVLYMVVVLTQSSLPSVRLLIAETSCHRLSLPQKLEALQFFCVKVS